MGGDTRRRRRAVRRRRAGTPDGVRGAQAFLREKGDWWVAKEDKGPSDPRGKQPTRRKRAGIGETFGGVDFYGNTKDELYERARKLGIEGRSNMSKRELARAIAQKQS